MLIGGEHAQANKNIRGYTERKIANYDYHDLNNTLIICKLIKIVAILDFLAMNVKPEGDAPKARLGKQEI